MTERFIVDTAGTLIDMVTRNTYDYVSEVCPLLNDIDSENTHVKYSLSAHMVDLNNCKGKCSALEEENEQLKQSNERIVKDIDLALGFIRHKGYSLQDIKDYEDAKKEYEEDLAYYRNGDVND